ncbi:hypothetical protein CDAR_575301 [Caerostris darwini]|uniref:Uncharacterized protein n=1 Tax=Caerostris darwini TaxID=1538125 RepID=A0AAV4RM76_9ARAC|nr:hypothetical protein CDAR_575301 [Caerostris darwini]
MTDQKDFQEYYHALRRQIKTQVRLKIFHPDSSKCHLCVKTTLNTSSRKVPETYRLQTSSTAAHLTQQPHFLEPAKSNSKPTHKKWVRSPYLIVKRAKQNTDP